MELNSTQNTPAQLTTLRVAHSSRALLLLAALLAAYQIKIGIEGMNPLAIACFTLAFGVVLVTALMMILLGYEVLSSSLLAITASLLPLGFSAGLAAQYLPHLWTAYLLFALLGFCAILFSRLFWRPKAANLILAGVHTAAGTLIFALPLTLSLQGVVQPGFALVSLGGALMGLGGVALAALKQGTPLLPQNTLIKLLPALIFLLTATAVAGLHFR